MQELNSKLLDELEYAEMLMVLQWVQRAMDRLARGKRMVLMSLKMLKVPIEAVIFEVAHSIWQCLPPLAP